MAPLDSTEAPPKDPESAPKDLPRTLPRTLIPNTREWKEATGVGSHGNIPGGRAKTGPNPPPPPMKLTYEVIDRAKEFLRLGAHIESIAALCGVSNKMWRTWYLRGARELHRQSLATHHKAKGILKEEQIYVALVQGVRESRATAEQAALLRIQMAAHKGAWKADSWWLQHSFPQRYAAKVQVAGPEGGPVQVNGAVTVVDVLRKVFAKGVPRGADPASTSGAGKADLAEVGVDQGELPSQDEA